MCQVTGSGRLGAFVSGLEWQHLPPDVRARTQRCLLDTLACAVAGSATPAAAATCQWARSALGPGEHTVIGRSERLGPAGAVTANAFAANALDLDDGYRPLKGHPGAIVVPAALAAAESDHGPSTGADLLAAVLVGYEVAMRAGLLIRREYEHYHGTGTWGAVGAAAAVARIRRLDPDLVDTTLAIAEFHAPMTPVMRAVDHPAMLKDGIGWGSLAGFAAVDLAVAGVTAPPSIFAHRAAEAERLPSLGADFLINAVYVKLSATCRWAQPAVAATLAAAAQLPSADDVAEVRVGTFEAATHLDSAAPDSTEAAQFSIPWAVACALLDGAVGPEQVHADRLPDPSTRASAARVALTVDPELEAQFPERALAWAEVTSHTGVRVRSGVAAAPGDPGDGVDDEVVHAKALRVCAPVLGATGARSLAAAVHDLPAAGDLRGLVSALRPPAAASA